MPGMNLFYALLLSLLALASAACTGKQNYTFRLLYQWTAEREGGPIPPTATFTHALAAAHKPSYTLWAVGEKASPAITELLDGRGIVKVFQQDKDSFSDYKKEGNAFEPANDVLNFNLTLDADIGATWVSIASGINPSPGWFIGREKFNLCDEEKGEWLDDKEDGENGWRLYGYDSGLGQGAAYSDGFEFQDKPGPISPLATKNFAYAELRMAKKAKDVGDATDDGDKLRAGATSKSGNTSDASTASTGASKKGWAIGGGLAAVLIVAGMIAGFVLVWKRRKKEGAFVPAPEAAEGGNVEW